MRMKNALNQLPICALVAALACLTAHRSFAADVPAGDRGNDPNTTFPDSFLVQNGGPILDVTRPPQASMRAAKGDGAADDTEALRDAYDFLKKDFLAKGGFKNTRYYIYLPNGTYLVKDTIIYHGDNAGTPNKWTGKFDIDNVRFIGQNRGKTIIRLADNAPGYQDPANPKTVLNYQHETTVFNNAPGGNYLRNLTIDTGHGNPGAIALFFQGANQTDIQHVTIQSGDGAGICGIWFKIGSAQGYYADVTVNGFDTGINDNVHGEGDVSFEYLTLTHQHSAGILHTCDGMSLRKILSDQQDPNVPAIRIDKAGTLTVVLGSQLKNQNSTKPAIELTTGDGQVLLARNVQTTGYASGITVADKAVADAGTIKEYLSGPVKTLSPDQPTHTLDLPIEDTPAFPQFSAADWAIVTDASQIQAAMDSGKPEIIFPNRDYQIAADIHVPASVKVINGLGANFKGKGLIVSDASSDPLFIVDGAPHTRAQAQRDIVEHCSGGGISNPTGLPVTFFLENVNDCTTGNDFCRPGQKVFARSIDIEYRGVEQIVCNGGALWILGYKTENARSAPFVCRNGGSLEILGGYTNTTSMPKSLDALKYLLTNDNSNVSASFFVNLRTWPKAVQEIRDGQTFTAAGTDLPSRGKGFGKMYVIPLYVGVQSPQKQ
jgi:hypothetical protein